LSDNTLVDCQSIYSQYEQTDYRLVHGNLGWSEK